MSYVGVIAPILFALRLAIGSTAIEIAALLMIRGWGIIVLCLTNNALIQGIGQLSALVIGRDLRQHGPVYLDRASSNLIPTMKTRHLPRVLFKLRFDLCLFDYYGVYGFHLLSEGAQVAFLDAFLLCMVTIIIRNFR